jgi:hypothetical protein
VQSGAILEAILGLTGEIFGARHKKMARILVHHSVMAFKRKTTQVSVILQLLTPSPLPQ